MTLLGTIVDTSALAKVIVGSLVAGIGVTIAFSFAILGSTRYADMRRDERPLEATVFAAIAIVAALACVAALVFGIIVMTAK